MLGSDRILKYTDLFNTNVYNVGSRKIDITQPLKSVSMNLNKTVLNTNSGILSDFTTGFINIFSKFESRLRNSTM